MKKLLIILLIIILILITIGVVLYFYITVSPTATALLDIKQGTVKIDQGDGWKIAVDELKLSLNDKIKTLDNSKASIILYESAIISLEPNSEVILKDLSKENLIIKLEAGRTNNKFTGLQGVKGLTIETPYAAANVRGTSFEVSVYEIIVAEGKVEVVHKTKTITIEQGEKVEISEEEITRQILDEEDKEQIIQMLRENINDLKEMRIREVNKKQALANQLKREYNLTDEQIKEKLEEADQGMYDLDEIEEKSPVHIEAVTKIKHLTEEIIKLNKEIKKLS